MNWNIRLLFLGDLLTSMILQIQQRKCLKVVQGSWGPGCLQSTITNRCLILSALSEDESSPHICMCIYISYSYIYNLCDHITSFLPFSSSLQPLSCPLAIFQIHDLFSLVVRHTHTHTHKVDHVLNITEFQGKSLNSHEKEMFVVCLFNSVNIC